MPTVHRSRGIPTDPERWDPSDKEYVWVCWSEVLEGSSISASSWDVPSGWDNNGEQSNQTVTDEDGISRTACNGVLLSTTETSGEHIIGNQVTLADGRIYERSIRIIVEQQ